MICTLATPHDPHLVPVDGRSRFASICEGRTAPAPDDCPPHGIDRRLHPGLQAVRTSADTSYPPRGRRHTDTAGDHPPPAAAVVTMFDQGDDGAVVLDNVMARALLSILREKRPLLPAQVDEVITDITRQLYARPG